MADELDLRSLYCEEDFAPELSDHSRGGHSWIVIVHYFREADPTRWYGSEFRVVAPNARDALSVAGVRAASVLRSHNQWSAKAGHVSSVLSGFEVFSIAWRGRVGRWTRDELGEPE